MLAAAAFVAPLLGSGAAAQDPLDDVLGDPGTTLPNLVPDSQDIRIENYRFVQMDVEVLTETGLFLLFETRAQNLGTVPVQLTVDQVESPQTSTVSQCTSWRAAEAHLCRATEPAGGYVWHDAHRHFHYEDFATYTLRRLAPDGRPDYSDTGLVRVADKVSFCFIDSRTVRDDARPTPFYLGCPPTVQGISPGWTDVYDYDTPGQTFPIEDLADGRYAVIIELDYENTLQETNDDDNYLELTVEISGMGTETPSASIVDRRWPAPGDRGTSTTTTSTKKPKRDHGWRARSAGHDESQPSPPGACRRRRLGDGRVRHGDRRPRRGRRRHPAGLVQAAPDAGGQPRLCPCGAQPGRGPDSGAPQRRARRAERVDLPSLRAGARSGHIRRRRARPGLRRLGAEPRRGPARAPGRRPRQPRHRPAVHLLDVLARVRGPARGGQLRLARGARPLPLPGLRRLPAAPPRPRRVAGPRRRRPAGPEREGVVLPGGLDARRDARPGAAAVPDMRPRPPRRVTRVGRHLRRRHAGPGAADRGAPGRSLRPRRHHGLPRPDLRVERRRQHPRGGRRALGERHPGGHRRQAAA